MVSTLLVVVLVVCLPPVADHHLDLYPKHGDEARGAFPQDQLPGQSSGDGPASYSELLLTNTHLIDHGGSSLALQDLVQGEKVEEESRRSRAIRIPGLVEDGVC